MGVARFAIFLGETFSILIFTLSFYLLLNFRLIALILHVYIGNLDQDRYFFANRELNHWNVNRSSRGSCVGFWKFTGSDKRICSKRMPIVGIKRTLVFYKGKHPFATRTDWFMHVYCIAISGNTACNMFQQKKHFQVICLIPE